MNRKRVLDYVAAVLATIALPFWLYLMKIWSEEPWMNGPGLIAIFPALMGVIAVVAVPQFWGIAIRGNTDKQGDTERGVE